MPERKRAKSRAGTAETREGAALGAEALKASGRPIVAVSPIIAGKAVKGPAAKIMGELGLDADSRTIAWHYEGLIDGLIIDTADEALAANLPMPAIVTNTMMRTLDDKVALARQCLAFCERLSRAGKAKAAR